MSEPNAVQFSPYNLIFVQSRAEINLSIVEEYSQMMADGVVFDAVEGVQDEAGEVFIWDGTHRGEAAKKAGTTLFVNIRSGTRTDAEWLALTANQKHGLRRTTKDKQRVVRQALLHPYGVSLSNREIARHCGVSDKTVGKARREMEVSAEIPQIDKRIIQRGGAIYQQDTTNIGSTKPAYAPVWKLETAIRQWLGDTIEDLEAQHQILAEIKDKTPEGQQYLSLLLSDDTLPSPNRKRDVIQACHNLLDQLRPKPQSLRRNSATLESSTDAWAYQIRESTPKGQINIQPHTDPQVKHRPQPQEFECPRCRQEKIVGVNGSRRWCLHCGAEWSTAPEFLAEVNANRDQAGSAPTRTELQQRFMQILAQLEEQDGRLIQIEIWLDELERQVILSNDLHPAAETVAPTLDLNSIPVLEYA